MFLSGEADADYEWALQQLVEVIEKEGIQKPAVAVTDRETALMKALDRRFPSTTHLLCRWHVNMNVLAKCKKFFPGPIRGEDGVHRRHPQFKKFLQEWNGILLATTEEVYNALVTNFEKNWPKEATTYATKTWLIFKEKLVKFWVDQTLHFGYLVTSPIEGCHSGLKTYLQRSTAGLDGVYQKLQLFWTTQYDRIRDITAAQLDKPRHHQNIPLFQGVIRFVSSFALDKILKEAGKISATEELTSFCNCTITQSLGLPCLHKIVKRKQSHGTLFLEDIHPHWLVRRPNGDNDACELVLSPSKIKGKGRPKGALGGGASREPASSTRRNPSAFELPSSSAPSALPSRSSLLLAPSVSSVAVSPSSLNNSTVYQAPGTRLSTQFQGWSTTQIALERITEQGGDTYEAGTARERGYMSGISSVWKDDVAEDLVTATTDIDIGPDDELDVLGGKKVRDDGDDDVFLAPEDTANREDDLALPPRSSRRRARSPGSEDEEMPSSSLNRRPAKKAIRWEPPLTKKQEDQFARQRKQSK